MMMTQNIALLITAKTVRQLAVKAFGIFLAAIPLVASTQMPRQPPNSWVHGINWYCNDGFEKSGNSCVSIFAGMPRQPPNSWVHGSNWYCNDGFKKSGNSCVSIFSNVPPQKQPQASLLESDRLAAENDAARQKQIELERQLAQQKKELEDGPRHREELQQKPAAKQKSSGQNSVDAANRKATVEKEKKTIPKQQAIPQPGSPISGGLPPLKK